MARRLSHAELEGLLGAYALDAVDADEARAVESHLQECPRCRAEVAEHRQVAAIMAHTGAAAPEGLWERIAAGLEEPPPALDLARVATVGGRRRSMPMALMSGMAAAFLLVVATLGVQLSRQERRIDRLTAAMERRGLDAAAASALVDAGSRRVDLVNGDGQVLARAVVHADGTGYVVPHRLPPLPADRTYQLWGMVDARKVSLGVLGPRPGVAAFKAHGEVNTLALTAEPAGGVSTSDRAPVVRGSVPRG